MTIRETTDQPHTHPYRSAVDPRTLDCDGLRVPYRGQNRMRLALSSGPCHGRIVINSAAEDLIAIQCKDFLPPLRLRVAAGEIALTWERVSFAAWLLGMPRLCNRDLAIVLHPAVDWTLAIRGGLAHCELDLSAGVVAGIDINGGCSDVRFELPVPQTAVPIRIAGGASQLVVQRPAETGVTLAASGGIATLCLDDQRFEAIGDSARLESRNIGPGAPRYELRIDGGAADLAIERRERSR